MLLSHFPRTSLVHGPTPLEPLPRLSRLLGGADILIKRDDCTGLAGGGNKARKLEFLLGDALKKGATHILTQGATQSNHVRQTAAASAKLGLPCTALLEERISDGSPDYYQNGNVLLDQLFDCALVPLAGGTDMAQALEDKAAEIRATGGTPYVIPGGGSNPVGALGYVTCAHELVWQANQQGVVIDHIVHATGSTGTQAGLLAGLTEQNAAIPLLGISVRAPRDRQEENVAILAQKTLDLLGVKQALPREQVVANSDYVGDGYGRPTDGMIEAIHLLARHEGILLDPVYSGKAFAGLVDLIRKGTFKKGQTVVFVHTGGFPGLFGYQDIFDEKSVPHVEA